VAAMSGSEKSAGDRARQGIRVAVEELNDPSADLVLGHKIAVRHADARSDARDAEAEAVRLASVNRVIALLGGTDSAQAEQLAKGAESAGVSVVVQAALPAASENAFSVAPSLARRGQVLGKYAAGEKKFNKVVIFADERSNATGPVAEAFAGGFGKDAATRFNFKSAEEFPALVKSAVTAKPQAVIFVGTARDLPRFRAELRKALPSVEVFFGGEESSIAALLGDRDGGDGVFVASAYISTDETPANQAFVRKYQEQFHELPDVNAALAYDGTRLLTEALRQGGAPNADKLRQAFTKLESFESVTGSITFAKDRHANRPLFVVQIKNGQAVLKKRYNPEE